MCTQAGALRGGAGALTCLYLSGNSIGSSGIQELAGAFSSCSSNIDDPSQHSVLLRRIVNRTDLLCCRSASGADFLITHPCILDHKHSHMADAVSKHKNLKQIYLRGNPLNSDSRSALEKVARHHPSLVIFV